MAYPAHNVCSHLKIKWCCLEITPFLFYCMCMLMSKTISIFHYNINALSKEAKLNVNSILNINIFIYGKNYIFYFHLKFSIFHNIQVWLWDSVFRWLTVRYNLVSTSWDFPRQLLFSTSVSYLAFRHHFLISLYANIFCCKRGFCFSINSPHLVKISSYIVENNILFLYSNSVTALNNRQTRKISSIVIGHWCPLFPL